MTKTNLDGRPLPPLNAFDNNPQQRRVVESVHRLAKGHTNNVFRVTLDANQPSTDITDDRITAQSLLTFMPETANAAAEIGNGTMYVASTGRVNGSVTVTHANNAQADRTFLVGVIG